MKDLTGLIELSPDPLILCREDGTIAGINALAKSLMAGRDPAPTVGDRFADVFGIPVPGTGQAVRLAGIVDGEIEYARSDVEVPGYALIRIGSGQSVSTCSFFAAHRTPLVLVDAETGVVVNANRAAEHFYGVSAGAFAGKSFAEFDSRAHRALLRALKMAVERNDGIMNASHTASGGILRDVQIHVGRAVIDGRDVFTCLVFDVSALMGLGGPRGTEELFRLITETSPTGIYLQHRSASYVNPALSRILGHSREALLSMSADEVIHPGDYDMVKKLGESVDGKRNVHYEVRILRPDGMTRWIEVFVNNIGYLDDVASIGTVVDVTGRKEMEEQLRSGREMFRILTEDALVGVLMYRDTIIYANPVACEIAGYGFEEFTSMSPFEWIHGDDRERLEHVVASRKDHRQPTTTEFRVVRKNGDVRRIRSHTVTIDHEGLPTSIANFMDITDSHEEERERIERDMQFREVFYRHDAVMILFEPDNMTVVDVNDAACRFYGLTRSELVGTHASIIIPNGENEILEGGRVQMKHLVSDGSTPTVEVHSSRIEVGGRSLIFSIVHDISLRVKLRQMLEDSEAMFRMLGEHLLSPVFICDDEIIYVNHSMTRLTEYDRSEIVDQPSTFWGKVLPDAKDAIQVQLGKRLNGEDIDTFTYPTTRLITKTGLVRWVVITTMGAVYRGRRVSIGTAIDITEMREAQERLQKQVKEESAHRQASESLLVHQSRLAVMGEMLNAITHQWRQPLSTIGLIAQDIEDAAAFNELDSDYVHSSVASIMQQIGFMSDTVEDFRNFFKPGSNSQLFDVVAAIHDVVRMLGAQFRAQSVELVIDGVDEAWSEGSVNEFKHVIINLLNNAREAIVSRIARSEPPPEGKIVMKVSATTAMVDIDVEDNGGGIPEEAVGKIFQPYFTTKPDDEGTGVGLYLSRSIVEKNLGGSMSFVNIDDGVRFTINLPRKEKP